jgi:hypothetical protein
MTKTIVRSQEEFEKALTNKADEIEIHGDFEGTLTYSPWLYVMANSQPHVEARANSQPHVEARENSQPHVEAWANSQPHVEAWANSQPHVEAWPSSPIRSDRGSNRSRKRRHS